MRKKQGRKGMVLLKLDLDMAYDSILNWDFTRDTLKEMGLSSHWIDVIMSCASSSTMRILWNGG